MKQLEFRKHRISLETCEVCYYRFTNPDAKETLLILPPGAMGGYEFMELIKDTQRGEGLGNCNIIVPDLPGRGESTSIEDNSFYSIACVINGLLAKIDIGPVHLVGISFGSAIANELLLIDKTKFTRVTLIAAGEFFNPIMQALLRVIFWFPQKSQVIRKTFKKIVMKYFDFFGDIAICDEESILKQWMEVLKYQINTDKIIDIPVKHIQLKNDVIITKRSLKKLSRVYPRMKTVIVDTRHLVQTRNFKEMMKVILAEGFK